jgi:hypothetical protein
MLAIFGVVRGDGLPVEVGHPPFKPWVEVRLLRGERVLVWKLDMHEVDVLIKELTAARRSYRRERFR